MDLIGILIQTLGGLGLFILGMKTMTDGLQMIAGQKIKKVLEAVSSNRILGCATGAGVTAVIQSSSATTVMLIGFVSAGIMTLTQATGIILGANIGTTVTAQMIAFKLSSIALPAIALGVPLKFFAKKRKTRYFGDIVLGFGILFYGMTVMKNGLGPIKGDPEFIGFFSRFATDNFGGILLCIGMGAIVTVLVQSSSATIGLTMTLAMQGIISFPTAMALVLGENIGTTITAWLATIGSNNIEAKRTAMSHTMFNVIGVCIMVIIFPFFLKFITFMTGTMGGAGAVDKIVNGDAVNIGRYIANGHTVFNVLNALIFLIFLPQLVNVVMFIFPKGKRSKERYRLPEFDEVLLDSSIGALVEVKAEVLRMGEFTKEGFKKVSDCLEIRDDDKLGEREAIEEHIDSMQKGIIKFLTKMYQGDVSEIEAKEISEMMRITNNLERIGDSMESISKILEIVYNDDLHLSENAVADLVAIAREAYKFIDLVLINLMEKEEDFFNKALANEDMIDHMREQMREKHIDRLRNDQCSVDAGVFYISMLSHFEKIGDHCFNIATGVSRIN
ncbi:MAG: Na/Pi cotransporter family protein [Desulfobacteraceae bacterium]|nr:Na/Pi cotransporter family protein [Desulfobacteraceae bacterium]